MENQIQLGHLSRLRGKINLKNDEVYFSYELITPEIAKNLLEKNTSNREIRPSDIKRYTADMNSNKWKENTAEPIKISKSGIILDGQHRLTSIIKSGRSIYFHVAYNLPDEIFDVIDSGAKRSPGDVLHIAGILNGKEKASVVRFYIVLKHGTTNKHFKGNITTSQGIFDEYKKRQMFWENVYQYSNQWRKAFNNILKNSEIGGLYAYLYDYNADKAFEFFDELCRDEHTKNEMVIKLKNKLRDDAVANKKFPNSVRYHFIIKTWNLYVSNKKVKVLKISPNEETPKPIIGDFI